ncbi:exocyst complex component exo84 [Mycoemilia scoparia]|uniref:Exocyst complex component EXO84 n=1 Tax=Mycoemilia scoparia TaxID=417184 RepID=A0A9W8DUR8_9FUNG|nr:exocyst complex component exo84 [Mycoemilia scoparia]
MAIKHTTSIRETRPVRNKATPSISIDSFSRPNFSPEQYLESLRVKSAGENIPTIHAALQNAKKTNSRGWQKALYTNYDSFIAISKEVSMIEQDMGIMQEYLVATDEVCSDLLEQEHGQQEVDENPVSRTARRRTVRMSTFYEQNNAEQVNKLINKIERARKLLPFSANRYIMGYFDNVYELSPSNQQARQHAHLTIFNDVILIAFYRRRSRSAAPLLIAEKCFSIKDTIVEHVNSTQKSRFIFKLSCNSETLWFALPSIDKMRSFSSILSSALNQGNGSAAAAASRKYQQGLHDNTDSNQNETSEDQEKDHELELEVSKLLDDLGGCVACREYLHAVQTIESVKRKLRTFSKPNQKLTAELEKGKSGLVKLILADLSLPCAPHKQISMNIMLLYKLGHDKEAKEAFLNSRSATIKHRTRQLRLEGDTQIYIRELSVVYFRLIRGTCDWYSDFFKNASMTSGEDKVEILGHAGLDLKFMLDQEFFNDLTHSIYRYGERCLHMLTKTVSDDTFAIVSKIPVDPHSKLAQVFGNHIPLANSVIKLNDLLRGFGEEVNYIVSDSLYGQTVISISSVIENILKNFLNSLRKRDLSVEQELALLVNTQAIISWAIPRCAQQLDRIFKRTVTDIHNLEHRLEGFPATLQEVFCQKQAQKLTQNVYSTHLINCSLNGTIEDDVRPSEGVENLLRSLGELGRELDNWPLRKRIILGGIIDHLFFILIDEKSWEKDGAKLEFGFEGVHKLVLDIHFLLRVCGSLVSKSTNALANKVCERALRSYFNGSLRREDKMKDRDWYDSRVYATMEILGYSFPEFGKGFEHRAQAGPAKQVEEADKP